MGFLIVSSRIHHSYLKSSQRFSTFDFTFKIKKKKLKKKKTKKNV